MVSLGQADLVQVLFAFGKMFSENPETTFQSSTSENPSSGHTVDSIILYNPSVDFMLDWDSHSQKKTSFSFLDSNKLTALPP